MRKQLLTAAIGRHESRFRELHDGRFREYAAHWGFEYRPCFGPVDVSPHHHLYWSKTRLIQDSLAELDDGDLVVWLDADILIVRGDVEVTTSKSLGITYDVWDPSNFPRTWKDDQLFGASRLNVGVLAVRNNALMRDLFQRAHANTMFDATPWPDQIALVHEMQRSTLQEMDQHFEIIPRCLNVTLGMSVPPEEIRFRHFAGEFHLGWDPAAAAKPIIF